MRTFAIPPSPSLRTLRSPLLSRFAFLALFNVRPQRDRHRLGCGLDYVEDAVRLVNELPSGFLGPFRVVFEFVQKSGPDKRPNIFKLDAFGFESCQIITFLLHRTKRARTQFTFALLSELHGRIPPLFRCHMLTPPHGSSTAKGRGA